MRNRVTKLCKSAVSLPSVLDENPRQLQHFLFTYGWSAGRLSEHLTHDPTRAYDYLKGKRLRTRATRQLWRAFMRRYRKSVLV